MSLLAIIPFSRCFSDWEWAAYFYFSSAVLSSDIEVSSIWEPKFAISSLFSWITPAILSSSSPMRALSFDSSIWNSFLSRAFS